MKILALIPARMGSTRFPGKPMAQLLGKPMIGHVYDRVSENEQLHLTAVATCDREIADYVRSIGGTAVMTGHHHERASDRCAEALTILERERGERFDIVVMVQGDEPMTHPQMISEAVKPLAEDSKVLVSNLLGEIESQEEFEDRNCIKVVCDQNLNAIYMSREPIPTSCKGALTPRTKQVCIIPFQHDFLLQYTSMQPTPLEIAESIDMLRVIENGLKVKMVPTKFSTRAVDTVEDLRLVEKLLMNQ